jgi:hypothetical protein
MKSCSQEKIINLYVVNQALNNRINQNYSRIYAVKYTLEALQSYSLWDRLCWSIKRIWEV